MCNDLSTIHCNTKKKIASCLPSAQLLWNMFTVRELTPLSDHCSVNIHLTVGRGVIASIKNNKWTTKSYYKWKDEDKNKYIEAINSADTQKQLIDIRKNLCIDDCDLNETVNTIQSVILEAAAPCNLR